MSNLGYEFDAAARVVGYDSLTVVFRPTPTEEHYDPEQMYVPGVALTGDVRRVTLEHPWHDRADWHIAPGAISMIDRKQKVVEAFSFGGAMHVESSSEQTVATIRSSAPIFEVIARSRAGAADAVSILIEEVTILLARARTTWGGDDAGFARNLSTLDPMLLYGASRRAVRIRLRAQPEHLRLTRYRETLHLLRVMDVEDPVPDYVAPLEELLRPVAIMG